MAGTPLLSRSRITFHGMKYHTIPYFMVTFWIRAGEFGLVVKAVLTGDETPVAVKSVKGKW